MPSPGELDPYGPGIRLPGQNDVRVTERFRDVIDSPEVQRLRDVRQLGPIHLVYPGATHTRFEHAIGALGMMQAALRNVAPKASLSEDDVLTGLAAALLHDVGHYPFAHSLEAVHRRRPATARLPRHEAVAGAIIAGSLGPLLRSALGVDPERVARLVTVHHSRHADPADALLASLISSGVDIDKLDYLARDSVHLGVAYGLGFDSGRLLQALQPSDDGRRVVVAARGRVPAELFTVARYLMFSEVYWHHTVRAVSAMVEAALDDVAARGALPADFADRLLTFSDDAFLAWLGHEPGTLAHGLVRDLRARRLHKRLVTYSRAYAEADKRAAYDRLYLASSDELAVLHARAAAVLAGATGTSLGPADLLIDTPPRDKDQLEPIEIVYGDGVSGKRVYRLDELSSVVPGVSQDFVKVVKKIRLFVSPRVHAALAHAPPLPLQAQLLEALLT